MNKQLSDAEIVRFYPGSNSTSDFVACARKVIAAALAGTEPSDFVIAELQNIASADIKNFVATNPYHEFFLWAQNRARHTLAKISGAALAHKSEGADLRAALGNLIEYVDRNECRHEETHRGGAIWTICDGCGRKWADDRGGFTAYEEPKALADARKACAAPAAPVAAPVDASIEPQGDAHG
jgi:hypothetical protein